MNPHTSKRPREDADSPSTSLKSRQPRRHISFQRTFGQQSSCRRRLMRNQPVPSSNTTQGEPNEDHPIDPAGFFQDDYDTNQDDMLFRENSNSPPRENEPQIEKISLAVDFGTENSAVTYKLHYEGRNLQPQPGKDQILPYLEKVNFSNCSYVKTQIGWHSDTLQMLFADEVTKAIGRGKLLRGSHIRGLKLSLLDPSEQTQAERSSLEAQMRKLPPKARFIRDQATSRL